MTILCSSFMDKAIPIQDIDIDLGKDSRYVLITCRQTNQVVNWYVCSGVVVWCAVMLNKTTTSTIDDMCAVALWFDFKTLTSALAKILATSLYHNINIQLLIGLMCAVMLNKTTKTTIGNNVSEKIIEYLRMPLKFDIQKKL